MEITNPCRLKLRRAFTDFGKLSIDEDRTRRKEFPQLFKQTSFASALIPNFNKHFKFWNNWTTPEINRANQIVLEHLKSRRHIQSKINEVPHTVPTLGADPHNHRKVKLLKRSNTEENNPHGEDLFKRQLILPKLEKDFFSSNNKDEENLHRQLHKRETTSVTANNNDSTDIHNINKNDGLLTSSLNKTTCRRNFHSDSSLINNSTSRSVQLIHDNGHPPEIYYTKPLAPENMDRRHFQQNGYQRLSKLPTSDREMNNNSHSPHVLENDRSSNSKQEDETAPSLSDDRTQRSKINTRKYLSDGHLSLENGLSSLIDDQVRQIGLRNDFNENHRKEISDNDGNGPLAFTLAKQRETTGTAVTGIPASLKDDFLTLPPHSIPFCNNDTTTTNFKRKVYHGDIAHPVTTNDEQFRILVWAGRDMSEECTAFHENLFPRLRHLGQQTGIEIEIFDLHLNQSDPAFLDSFRLELFTDILNNLFNSGCKSKVVILLGEKYGAPILPSTISSLEFNSLQHRLDTSVQNDQLRVLPRSRRSSSRSALRSRSVSSATGSRRLRPPRNHVEKSGGSGSISRVGTPTNKSPRIFINDETLPGKKDQAKSNSNGDGAHASGRSVLDDLYRTDNQGRQEVYRLKNLRFLELESGKWKEQISAILNVLSRLEPTPENEKYQQSLLDAILSSASCASKTTATDDNFLCVVRHVTNIDGAKQTLTSHNYFDTNSTDDNKNVIDRRLNQKIKEIRSRFICSKVPAANVVEFQLDLREDVAQSIKQRQFDLNVERVQDKLYKMLSADILKMKRKPEDKILQEVLHHVAYCQQRARDSCLIQKKILQSMMIYITSTKPDVLILHGPDGSGKTTLMSLAAVHVKFWTGSSDSKNHVLVRVVGYTRDSTNICDLLHGLCTQLQDIFHISAFVPTDYTGVINQFSQLLGCACATDKLVIFLDGVDLLEGRPETNLQWIPKKLPAHVRLIISTRSHDHLKILRRTFVQRDVFKEISPLDEPDIETLFSNLQKKSKQIVLHPTKSEIIEQLQTERFPLNLTLVKDTDLSGFCPSAKELIGHKFNNLEQQFGGTFVQRVIGHLTAAKFGLAFTELESILAIDRASASPSHSSSQQRSSSYQLLSFLSELRPYLQECVDGVCRVLCWRHRIFREAAEDRYLNNQIQTLSYHKNLAMFFNYGVPVFDGDKKTKMVPNVQPLVYNGDEPLCKRYFNLRKLKEFPFHLVQLQQYETLKKDVIFSFQWMQSELCATSFANVLRLRTETESSELQNTELGLLTTALKLSELVLKTSPDQLASQLIGRLADLSNTRIQTSSVEAPKYPNLVRLIDSARYSSLPVLLPQGTCLVGADDELPIHLYGHVAPVNAMDLTADGSRLLTASKDDSIKVWDMSNGRVVQNINGIGAKISALIWAVNDTCAVTVEPGYARVWLLADQICLHSFETGGDSMVVTTVSNSDFVQSVLLVAIYEGSNKISVWNLQDGSSQTHSIGLKGNAIHQSRSVLLSRNCKSSCFLYSFRDSNNAVLQNASNGNIVFSLQCREGSSMIVGVAVTPDYLVLACRQLYLKSQEIHQLELFAPSNGLYLRSVRGCVHDVISSPLVVPRTGSNILHLSTSRQNNVSNVTVWNLETESHKHLSKHAGVSELLACDHFGSVLTASKGDNYIKRWDLSVKITQTTPELKSEPSISRIIMIDSKPDCFVTLTVNNGPIGLWTFNGNLNNISLTSKTGFLDPFDVVLVNNTKLVILSDRKLPNIEDDMNQIFQSILIYDLETKSYDRKLSDCYIDVSPADDYVILPEDRLMGLSSSRNHFIIWSLISGQVVQRIRSCFKALNWSSRTNSKYFQVRESITDMTLLEKRSETESALNMTPWGKRSETESARSRRCEQKMEEEMCRLQELRKEKENSVDGFLVSRNPHILVVSYFAHHLCVFEIETQRHLTTIEDKSSMLFLHVAAITADGSHFVHTTYDEMSKTSYVTLRETRFGRVKRRLKNEKDVCAVALTDSADRVVIVKRTNEIHIWDPMVTNSLRKHKLQKSLKLDFDSRLFLVDGGRRAVLFAGQISLWDLDRAELVATFSHDSKVLCCNIISQGDFIVLGTSEETRPIVLTVKNAGTKTLNH